MSGILKAGRFVDDPVFCMTREVDRPSEDPRLEFPRALFIAGSIMPGDDSFVAIRRENLDEYNPPVLVFDWRETAPHRWAERGTLSELIKGIGGNQ
jgi:hypothetical protein